MFKCSSYFSLWLSIMRSWERNYKGVFYISFLILSFREKCVCPLPSATGYDYKNLLCKTDPSSPDHCWTVRARWVNWINIYGSWLSLSSSLFSSWTGRVGLKWEEREVKIIPYKKTWNHIRRPVRINYILWDYFFFFLFRPGHDINFSCLVVWEEIIQFDPDIQRTWRCFQSFWNTKPET